MSKQIHVFIANRHKVNYTLGAISLKGKKRTISQQKHIVQKTPADVMSLGLLPFSLMALKINEDTWQRMSEEALKLKLSIRAETFHTHRRTHTKLLTRLRFDTEQKG